MYKVKLMREKLGWTQEKLSEISGVSRALISMLETSDDGTLYTVWVKWVGGQCIYRPHKRVNCSYRVVPDTKWHQTEQAAQAELDIEASVQGWKEEENGD